MDDDSFKNPFDQDQPPSPMPAFDDSAMMPLDDDSARNRRTAWVLFGIAILGCGCFAVLSFFYFKPDTNSLIDRYFPSPTATATSTPNWTATAQAFQTTATAQALQTNVADASTQWKVWLIDSFDSNDNDWSTGNDDDEWANITRTIENGSYIWAVTSKKGFIGWVDSDTGVITDFYLAVDIQQTSGSTSDTDYGLIFREDNRSNFYYFGVDNLNFHVSLNYDDEWLDVIEWTETNAIQTDGLNRLAVIAKDSHFIFLINGQVVGEADDDHIRAGTSGLAIQVHGNDLHATFQFDNFELRNP